MSILILLDQCKAIPVKEFMDTLKSGKLGSGCGMWSIYNEIKPSDLYCYLYAKFGVPNGMQNLLRNNHSDNLIHWEWAFEHQNGFLIIQGANMRTEVILRGDGWKFSECDRQNFIDHVKRDIGNYGKRMSEIRAEILEDWDLVINPYRQLRASINELKRQLDALELNINFDKSTPKDIHDLKQQEAEWAILTRKFNHGIGLSMAIRTMTPILAESFVNMLIFILCRPEIKTNKRLYENYVRSNIDVKIQSLHINCRHFKQAVDWNSEVCGRYNTIVNTRNDMLHGNVVPDKLKFSEIFFNGTVPVFKKYESMWQRGIGTSIDAAGFDKVTPDLKAVDDFIHYVISCLEDKMQDLVMAMLGRRDIGINKKDKRIGMLLPEHIVDSYSPAFPHEPNNPKPKEPLVNMSGKPL